MAKKKFFIIFGVVIFIAILALGLFFIVKSSGVKESVITFTKTGNISKFETTGFYTPEDKLTWTIENESGIVVPTPKIPDNHTLSMSFEAVPFLVEKKLKKQIVDVFVNDVFVKKITLDKTQIYNFDFVLPPDAINQDTLNIKFKMKSVKTMKELKIAPDNRKFGIALIKMTLKPIDNDNINGFQSYKIGHRVSFNADGDSQKYLGPGWSMPEKKFLWTDGKDAYINMFIKDAIDKKLQLNISGSCIFDFEKYQNQKITVFVNDTKLTTWNCDNEDNVYTITLPEDIVKNGAIQIKLNIEKPFVPGTDKRQLGMAVKTLQITQIRAAKTKVKIARWLKNDVLKVPQKNNTEK